MKKIKLKDRLNDFEDEWDNKCEKSKKPDLERANHEWFNLFDRAEW